MNFYFIKSLIYIIKRIFLENLYFLQITNSTKKISVKTSSSILLLT